MTNPSGKPLPTGAPPGYIKRFTDDFNGTDLSKRWNRYSGQPGGDPAGYWLPSHAVVQNGLLTLKGYKENTPVGTRLVTAGVSNRFDLRQTYGRFDVRMRVDKGRGVSYAMLTWPNDHSGPPELDFGEDNGAGDRSEVNAFTHYGTAAKHQQQRASLKVDMSQWHTIGMQWGPTRVDYTIDGRIWASHVGANVTSHEPMFLALQTQSWPCGSYQKCPDSTTPANVNLYVDWVAIYRVKS